MELPVMRCEMNLYCVHERNIYIAFMNLLLTYFLTLVMGELAFFVIKYLYSGRNILFPLGKGGVGC